VQRIWSETVVDP